MEDKLDFNRLWSEQIRQSSSARMTDDGAERAFWRDFMARRQGYAPDESSRQVVRHVLLPLIRTHGISTALEWGPGWGNYTIDLARACSRVTCVDLSQDVLDFILRVGAEQGCGNLDVVQAKWEEFSPAEQSDLVFGYNCFYRQEDLAGCLLRMDRAAKKLCVAGMNSGPAPVWARELAAAGAGLCWDWKNERYFAGTLRQLGIDAHVCILPFERRLRYPDEEALLRGECARCAPGSIGRGQALDILRRHFVQGADGSWSASAAYHSGLVWWVPTGEGRPAARVRARA